VPTEPALALILPVYNESTLLEPVLAELLRQLADITPDFEIVLSENGSTDGSAGLVDALAAREPRVRVVHAAEADYGFALRRGLLAGRGAALAHFSVDFVDVEFLRQALGMLDEYDIVIGSKQLQAGRDRRGWVRRIGGRVYHAVAQTALGLPIADTHGIKVMRRARVAEHIAACTHGGALFDDEFILRAARAGLRLAELPVHVREARPSRKGIAMLAVKSLIGLVQIRRTLR
jgi:glycosyltransferase involved in cell wall biosynthesis